MTAELEEAFGIEIDKAGKTSPTIVVYQMAKVACAMNRRFGSAIHVPVRLRPGTLPEAA